MGKHINYKKLRDLRVDKDLTQKEMASKLNVVPSAYSKIERGKRILRVDQLEIIAHVLGKDISDFIIRAKNNANNSNPDPIENLKIEVELLEKILLVISAEVEKHLFEIIHKYASNYPERPLTYEEFLKDSHCNPDEAVWLIKRYVEEYQKDGEEIIFGKNVSVKKFIGRDDKWIKDFVTKEENYEAVFEWMMAPHLQSQEDLYSAFKDFLNAEPLIHTLFKYGLLEESWHAQYWKKYQEETNFISEEVSAEGRTKVVKQIREVMKDIFTRRSKEEYRINKARQSQIKKT